MSTAHASGMADTGAGGMAAAGSVHTWERDVPVLGVPLVTRSLLALAVIVLVGALFAGLRHIDGALGEYSGMNDYYAWGIWKTFNVMVLTALGSGGFAVGIAVWVCGRKSLHSVMRVALVTSLLFYMSGLIALGTDVGRPWNFYNALLPWNWNTRSALWVTSMAMPLYALVFLAWEISPMVVERVWFRGSPGARAVIRRWRPRMRAIYPFMIAGAYLLPLVHQPALGGLMLLAGDRVHPLWQSELLPLLYVIQAGICGFGTVIVFLMGSSLVWRRPIDMPVLAELANWMSWLVLGFSALRFTDLAVTGDLPLVLAFDGATRWFLLENALILVPALVLRSAALRATPRVVFRMAVLATAGGMLYRFLPTTIAFDPGPAFIYFPSVAEVLVTLGLMALVLAGFSLAVKLFAVLPAPMETWTEHLEAVARADPATRRDRHGNPIDD